MKQRGFAAYMAAAMLVLGTAVAALPGMVAQATAHECPPEGCIVDGRMTGGGRLAGETLVIHGFVLQCDVNASPNKLQVNWGSGNSFHMTSLTQVRCLDDPTIDAHPPKADFDRIEGFGIGRLNGADGAEIYFEFTDAGQPGKSDIAFIVIRDAAGSVVFVANEFLQVGNHQAHNVKN